MLTLSLCHSQHLGRKIGDALVRDLEHAAIIGPARNESLGDAHDRGRNISAGFQEFAAAHGVAFFVLELAVVVVAAVESRQPAPDMRSRGHCTPMDGASRTGERSPWRSSPRT
jgi:hypothetical protein